MRTTARHLVWVILILFAPMVSAMPIYNMPVSLVQPNGDTLHCYVSGDEYYHRLHDADGYTIVQHPQTGYWVYADTVHTAADRWQVVPTDHVAGSIDPHAVADLAPNVGPDGETLSERQRLHDTPKQPNAPKTSGRNHGRMNNIVVFVRFSDQTTELGTLVSDIDMKLNDSSANATSMYSYFKQVSYNKLEIVSHFFPTPVFGLIPSYADIHPRSYYLPYNSVTNPDGYNGDYERLSREHGLLRRAVNYISQQVPDSLDLDIDNDGFVDNVCLVAKGVVSAWGELLWPHKGSLTDSIAYLGSKQVYSYNLMLEGDFMYFTSKVFCHEMFHSLGAPDLYHHSTNASIYPVGQWDLMGNSNNNTPQHMSAYMKWKYGNWLDSIPEITQPGTYTLHSLGDSTHDNCCYRIATSDPHQWYVLEYRDNTERFETTLPGKGLLIYRIDDRYTGSVANDEVYLFRPNASTYYINGTLAQAFFSGSTSRTSFTPHTNPHPWLTGGVIDSAFAIVDITVPDSTISFTYAPICVAPHDLAASNLTDTSAFLSWESYSENVLLQWRSSGSATVNSVVAGGNDYHLGGLASQTTYEWRLKSLCGEDDSSAFTAWSTFATLQCTMLEATVGLNETTSFHLPFNTWYKYSYSQMIYTAAELGGPMEITALEFDYGAWNRPVSNKNNCIVYLGTTADSCFAEYSSAFKPFAQLVQVYEGPISCDWGWNAIELDNPFYYNGTDNLIVAIDDNSGTENSTHHRFRCTNTPGRYTSMTCYSDNINPDPANNLVTEHKEGYQYRADIRFSGCPLQAMPSFQVSLSASDSTQGSVDGGGTYDAYTMVTVTATPAPHYHFAYWLSDGDTITANPYTFSVAADRALVAWFAIDSFVVSVNATDGGTVSGNGVYQYGETATIVATPSEAHHFTHWTTGTDAVSDNPYTFVVCSDTSFTAHFAIDSHYVSVASNDTAIGQVSQLLSNGELLPPSAWVPHGTVIWLIAEPRYDVEGYQCSFVQWSDGSVMANRSITLTQDTMLVAIFEAQPIEGIAPIADHVAVVQRDGGIELVGAAGHTAALYDVVGRCHWHSIATSHLFIPLPRPGVYLLCIDGYAPRKVVFR